jgi:hypothetical protein
MQRWKAILIAIACVTLGTACYPPLSERGTRLVPGADQVRLTKNPDDVANCKPVGNVHIEDLGRAREECRNKVVGLGGNAAMVTEGSLSVPHQGVAYRCP